MNHNPEFFSREELLEENRTLYEEVLVSRKAADITANLVAEQFSRLEEILRELENKVAMEKELREKLSEKLQEAEIRENELGKARIEAETANEAKSAFLASTSHELRTPLTSILGFAKIIQKRMNDVLFPVIHTTDKKTIRAKDQVKTNLDIIITEGERLTNLINNVLDLSKIESGKMEWHMAPLDIRSVIERALAAVTPLLEQTSLEITTSIPLDLPQVIGDRDQLIQVVVNLLSNAVKFSTDGEIICSVEPRAEQLVISVADQGLGISESQIESVFEKFIQIGDTLTDKPKGTGLGLTICKQIIKYHNGEIWVESRPGGGAVFFFSLPLAAEVEEGTTEFENFRKLNFKNLLDQLKGHETDVTKAAPSRKKTVLVVDDEAHIRLMLRQELEGENYGVIEAVDGMEAIEQVKKRPPDLIILDVMMPKMSGFDVAAVLKNNPLTQNIPIIILSIVQDKERGYRIGVDKYLSKPVNMENLFNEISHLIRQEKSSKKVLIVDENKSTVKTLADVLRLKGYQVHDAAGAEEGIQKARAIKPDMVILDTIQANNRKIIKTLRFDKELENIFFILLGDEDQGDRKT
ncbi:response regulator [Desulfobacterales bacterium HSG17]|nr:response regulator [Desulfobacterales bacterium HSG17]